MGCQRPPNPISGGGQSVQRPRKGEGAFGDSAHASDPQLSRTHWDLRGPLSLHPRSRSSCAASGAPGQHSGVPGRTDDKRQVSCIKEPRQGTDPQATTSGWARTSSAASLVSEPQHSRLQSGWNSNSARFVGVWWAQRRVGDGLPAAVKESRVLGRCKHPAWGC